MNDLEFAFEAAPWEAFLQGAQPGDSRSALELLTLLEGEEEDVLEEALEAMEDGGLTLDVSSLTASGSSGDFALRLRREAQLVKDGLPVENLEQEDPLRLYLEELAAIPACGEETLLAVEAAAGKERAREMLTNLGLSRVVALAGEYTGKGVLLMDLIQEGSMGLWKAVCQYREGDYAAQRDHWIRFYMAKAVTAQARSTGAGERMRTAMEDYRAVDERLLGDLGRNPTLEEIATELHMTAEEAAAVKKMLEDARILAQVRRVEPEEPTEEDEQAVEDTAQFQMRQRILDLLSGLEETDQKLLTLRFGLEGGKPLTPEETGRKLNLTPEEVIKREAAALMRLRSK